MLDKVPGGQAKPCRMHIFWQAVNWVYARRAQENIDDARRSRALKQVTPHHGDRTRIAECHGESQRHAPDSARARIVRIGQKTISRRQSSGPAANSAAHEVPFFLLRGTPRSSFCLRGEKLLATDHTPPPGHNVRQRRCIRQQSGCIRFESGPAMSKNMPVIKHSAMPTPGHKYDL